MYSFYNNIFLKNFFFVYAYTILDEIWARIFKVKRDLFLQIKCKLQFLQVIFQNLLSLKSYNWKTDEK